MLRATTACTFSTSQLQKVVREWCALYILTSKCASRHNGVHFSTSQLPKVVRTPGAFNILTSKCASRHNGVHFSTSQLPKSGPRMVCFVHFDFEMCLAPQRRALFNISTSKSGPRTVCFVHVDFEMCFAPQRRALFPHHNFQKWCFVRFDLEMCFAPQRRALFRHRNFQKWCFVRFDLVMCFAPQRRAIFHLSSGQPVPLASLLFDPPEPQIIGKTQCFATFLPFRASASSFFLLFLFYSSFF